MKANFSLKRLWYTIWSGYSDSFGLKRWLWFSSSIAAGVLVARYIMEVMA